MKVFDFGLAKALDPVDDRRRRCGGLADDHHAGDDRRRRDSRDRGLHESRTSERPRRRQAHGRLGVRLRALRDANRRAARSTARTSPIPSRPSCAPILIGRALPVDATPQIRLLLKRCLEKDRRARISDIGCGPVPDDRDHRFVASAADLRRAPGVWSPHRGGRRGGLVARCARGRGRLVGLVAVSTGARPAVRFRAHAARGPAAVSCKADDRDLVVAPDGSFVVYRSGDSALMRPRLMIRSLNQLDGAPLADTGNARNPFLSPDGRWVGFFRRLGDPQGAGSGRTVGGDRERRPGRREAPVGEMMTSIVFATSDGAGLQRVAANGGEPERVDQDRRREPRDSCLPARPAGQQVCVVHDLFRR